MNKLKLKEAKAKLIQINMNSESDLEINGQILEKVDKMIYLGIIIGKKIGFFKEYGTRFRQ